MTLPANNVSLIEGPFAVAVTIRRSGGGDGIVRACIWERGSVMMEAEDPDGGEPTRHSTERLQATFAAEHVSIYSEGDEVVRNGRTHTILDAISDEGQTTFTLTK